MEDILTSSKRPTWLGNQEKERKKKHILMSIKRLRLKTVTCEQQTKKCECSRGWESRHDDCNIGRISQKKAHTVQLFMGNKKMSRISKQ